MQRGLHDQWYRQEPLSMWSWAPGSLSCESAAHPKEKRKADPSELAIKGERHCARVRMESRQEQSRQLYRGLRYAPVKTAGLVTFRAWEGCRSPRERQGSV